MAERFQDLMIGINESGASPHFFFDSGAHMVDEFFLNTLCHYAPVIQVFNDVADMFVCEEQSKIFY